MQETFASTFRNADSPVQKIFNSQHFSRWFEDFVCQESLGPRAANLSAAKHRFASFAKPMGRMLLHLRSFFEFYTKSLRSEMMQHGPGNGWKMFQLICCCYLLWEPMQPIHCFS